MTVLKSAANSSLPIPSDWISEHTYDMTFTESRMNAGLAATRADRVDVVVTKSFSSMVRAWSLWDPERVGGFCSKMRASVNKGYEY